MGQGCQENGYTIFLTPPLPALLRRYYFLDKWIKGVLSSYYNFTNRKEALSQQLKLAKELDLAVILHCRMGHKDLIDFLKENLEIKPERAVAHAFVGSLEELQGYLDFGFSIGFNGIIFKTIEGINFEESIRETPLDRILVETDCPYLTPPPIEGRNEPLYIKHVVGKIAQIKNISYEEVAKITTENAKKLFKI